MNHDASPSRVKLHVSRLAARRRANPLLLAVVALAVIIAGGIPLATTGLGPQIASAFAPLTPNLSIIGSIPPSRSVHTAAKISGAARSPENATSSTPVATPSD